MLLNVTGVAADEGTVLTLTATLSTAAEVPVTFAWATADGTAKSGTNYVAGAGNATIAAGALSTTFDVTTLDDLVATSDLTFAVNLSNVVGAFFSGGVTATIQNVDPPTITGVSPSNGSALGGDTLTITGTGFLPGAIGGFQP